VTTTEYVPAGSPGILSVVPVEFETLPTCPLYELNTTTLRPVLGVRLMEEIVSARFSDAVMVNVNVALSPNVPKLTLSGLPEVIVPDTSIERVAVKLIVW
jgi:hypothetical protein